MISLQASFLREHIQEEGRLFEFPVISRVQLLKLVEIFHYDRID